MKRVVKSARDPFEAYQNARRSEQAIKSKKQDIKAKLFDLVCDDVFGHDPEDIIQRIIELPYDQTIDDVLYCMKNQHKSFLDALEDLENAYIDPKDLY